MQGGSSAGTNVITGGTSNPKNSFRGSFSSIQSRGDAQQINFTAGGAINITGGSVGSNNVAQIQASFGNQTITGAPIITLRGGASGGTQNTAVNVNEGNFALISALVGNQNITAGAINITGGENGTNNSAQINANGSGITQTISATGITIQGGDNGTAGNVNATGNNARIRTTASQSVTVGIGGLSLTGGSGSSLGNYALVQSAGGVGTSQTINVNNGGSLTLQGGSSTQTNVGVDANGNGNGSFANISASGDTQQINFSAGGAISVTGGSVGSRNSATINSSAANSTQTITGSPNVTMTGGQSGGFTGEGNSAGLNANAGTQNLTLGTVHLTGGNGVDNSAAMQAPSQIITVNGNLNLSGATGGSGSVGSRIGGPANTATNLGLTVHGSITLDGGAVSGAGSALGPSPSSTTAQIGNETISADGDITMNGGTLAGTRIGQPNGLVGGGDISVTAGGNISLAGNATTSGTIRTAGNVALNRNQHRRAGFAGFRRRNREHYRSPIM